MEKRYSYAVLIGLGLTAILFVIINFKVTIKVDDDYIGEQVYWLLHDGKVKSELMRGYGNIGLENYQSVFHKLFIYAGAAVSKISGWSLNSLHMVSVFFTLITVLSLYYFCIKNYSLQNFFSALLLIFSFFEFTIFTFSFRPEIMVMALGFLSYIFLSEYAKNKKITLLLLSSVFASLAFLTHLNGLIFVLSGIVLLSSMKDVKALMIFGIVTVMVFIPVYFFDVLKNASFDYFLFQFRHDPSLNESNFHWYTPFIRLLREHYRLFRSPMEISLTVLTIFSFVCLLKNEYPRNRNLIIYTVALFLSLAIYAYSKTSKYTILYLPFLALIIASAGDALLKNVNKKDIRRTIYFVLFGLYVLTGLIFTGRYALTMYMWTDLASCNKNTADLIPEKDKQRILAPGAFIFDEIKEFDRIMNMNRFTFFIESHNKPRINFDQLLDSARFYHINYIIFSEENAKYFKLKENIPEFDERTFFFGKNEYYQIVKLEYK